ncbi:TPA: hypothetical protein ACH3X1_008195 [Trebouxia sp. C0004]
MEETKGVELSSSADRKVVKGRHDIASKVQPATNFVHQHRQGRGLLPKVNMGQGTEANMYAQDIKEATQLDANGSSMSTSSISWAISPLVSPSLLPVTAQGVVQVSRSFHVGVGAVANASS